MNRKSHLALYSIVYAIFYSFCLYKNLGGATFPFFVIGTLCYIYLCTKEFSLTWKKDSTFLSVAVILIGISQPLTDKGFIHFFNVLFVFSILIYITLRQFAFDENWTFLQSLGNLMQTFFGAFSKLFAPFKDLSAYLNNRKENGEDNNSKIPWKTIIITFFITLPFLIIVILILSNADYIFSNMWEDLFDIILPDMQWLKVILLTLIVFLFGYGLITYLLKFPFSGEAKTTKQYNPAAAITAGIMFDIIYAIFCFIQIFYLFMGRTALPTGGRTYAEYAREGFFELLFICLLNLVLVLIGSSLFSGNKILKITLSFMCGCTYIMTASSAFRMILYIRYYYFTFLRILVLWALVVIAILVTGLLMHLWKKKFNLFKFSLTVILSAYIVLAFSHTDYLAVKWNMSQVGENAGFFIDTDGYEDYDYILYETCLDSAPIVYNYPELAKQIPIYRNMHSDITKKASFREFNLSVFLARKYDKMIN